MKLIIYIPLLIIIRYSSAFLKQEYMNLTVITFQDDYILTKPNTGYVKHFDGFITAEIYAFNKRFKFIAIKMKPVNVVIIGSEATKIQHANYQGSLYRQKNSRVHGYKYQNAFLGYIRTNDDIFHLELHDVDSDLQVVMYAESSHKLNRQKLGEIFKRKHSSAVDFSHPVDFIRNNRQPLIKIPANLPLINQVCDMQIIVDYTYYISTRGITEVAAGEVLTVFDRANEIFERTDFDGDGVGDGIGIRLVNLVVYKRPIGELNKRFANVDELLDACTYIPQQYCLSYCFVNMDFGKSFGASAWFNPTDRCLAGICAPSFRGKIRANRRKSRNIYPNSGAVTKLSEGNQISRILFATVFTHEVGHAFGADHDPSSEIDDTIVEYNLMREEAIFPRTLRYIYFSDTSRREINRTLQTQAGCFSYPDEPICGNGLTEVGEECDCGSPSICLHTDPCCLPIICRLRPNLQCDSRDLCCNSECEFKTERVKCSTDCFEEAFCTGHSAECPENVPLRPGSACNSCTGYFRGRSCLCDGKGFCTPDIDVYFNRRNKSSINHYPTRNPISTHFTRETLRSTIIKIISRTGSEKFTFIPMYAVYILLIVFIIILFWNRRAEAVHNAEQYDRTTISYSNN